MTTNKYWLYLNSNSFLWTKGAKGIVYNSENFKCFMFNNSNSLNKIIRGLSDIENLYCIELDEHQLTPEVNKWIAGVQGIKAGGMVDKNNASSKPICYYPVLNLQSDIKRLGQNSSKSIDRYQNEYFQELTIYLNGDKTGNDEFCKQFTYPTTTKAKLNWGNLNRFLLNCQKEYYLQTINICGDITNYDSLDELKDTLQIMDVSIVRFFVKLDTLLENLTEMSHLFMDKWQIHILVDDIEHALNVKPISQIEINNNIFWHFIASKDKDIETYEAFVENNNITQFRVTPVYTEFNWDFFVTNVCLNERDILEASCWTKQHIFAHQAMNTSFFGRLTIMPDGKVYSNLNFKPIGNVISPVNQIVHKAMDKKSPWFLIRKGKDCKGCIFRWLCPSPSNYEIIMKRNLCDIKMI